jgi:hypothetical protein
MFATSDAASGETCISIGRMAEATLMTTPSLSAFMLMTLFIIHLCQKEQPKEAIGTYPRESGNARDNGHDSQRG